MSDSGQQIGKRLDDTLDACIAAAQILVNYDEAGKPLIILPVTEWSRLVQDAARAVGYMTWESSP